MKSRSESFVPALICACSLMGTAMLSSSALAQAPAEPAPAKATLKAEPASESKEPATNMPVRKKAKPKVEKAITDDDLLDLEEETDEDRNEKNANKPTVGFAGLIAVGDASDPLADQVSLGITRELKDAPFVLVPMAAAKAGAKKFNESLGKKERARADKSLASGKVQLKNQQFGKAKKLYERALAEYQKAAATLESIEPVIQTHLGLAEIGARLGKEEVSSAQLEIVAQLDPEFKLDSTVYPAPFIATFEKVRDAQLDSKGAQVIIDATATGAEVIIDGRSLGKAPMKVSGLLPGTHYIRVFRAGVGLFGQALALKSNETKTLSPGFTDLSATGPTDLLKLNKFSGEAARVVAEVARQKNHKGALVGVISKRKQIVPTAFIYIDAKSAAVRRIGPIDFDADLLNLAIEGITLQNAVVEALKGENLGAEAGAPLLEGVSGANNAEIKEVNLRFDVKKSVKKKRKKRKRRAIGNDDEEGGRRVARGSDRTSSLKEKDEDDVLRATDPAKKEKRGTLDEDLPLTEQAWFWPAVIGGGVAGVAIIGGGTYAGLVAADVLPDPRPVSGIRVTIEAP